MEKPKNPKETIGRLAKYLMAYKGQMLLVIVGFIYSLWSQGSRALIWIIGSLLLSLIVAMVMKRNKTV